jgi:hypothetical protein
MTLTGTGPRRSSFSAADSNELVTAGVLPAERRPGAEYPVWSSVHGMAVLITQGPVRGMPAPSTRHLTDQLLAFIARGI